MSGKATMSADELFVQAVKAIEQDNYTEGLPLLQKSIEGGHADACIYMALLIFAELDLRETDLQDSDLKDLRYLLSLALERGAVHQYYAAALTMLFHSKSRSKLLQATGAEMVRIIGRLYAEEFKDDLFDLSFQVMAGRSGIPSNEFLARELMEYAGNGGLVKAKTVLGIFLACGLGGPRETERSIQLLEEAESEGDENAINFLSNARAAILSGSLQGELVTNCPSDDDSPFSPASWDGLRTLN